MTTTRRDQTALDVELTDDTCQTRECRSGQNLIIGFPEQWVKETHYLLSTYTELLASGKSLAQVRRHELWHLLNILGSVFDPASFPDGCSGCGR